jgi:SAM-dependent methyltransferase
MSRDLDALTSSTLKHLRDQWWNDAFTSFLEDTLRPRAGKRILDVGCGTGTAEVSLARLRLSQVDLFGVDLVFDRVRAAQEKTRGMNAHVNYAVADACHLPFGDAVFDSTFCVAVLQHIRDIHRALSEIARVSRPEARILVVEPDNAARYWFSSLPSGMQAFELGRRFFAGLASSRGETPASAIGPLVSGMMTSTGIRPISVQLFPVSNAYLGTPPESLWQTRRKSVGVAIARAPNESLKRLGTDYLKAIDEYANDAAAAGPGFAEIQNTMLFATVGERVGA